MFNTDVQHQSSTQDYTPNLANIKWIEQSLPSLAQKEIKKVDQYLQSEKNENEAKLALVVRLKDKYTDPDKYTYFYNLLHNKIYPPTPKPEYEYELLAEFGCEGRHA